MTKNGLRRLAIYVSLYWAAIAAGSSSHAQGNKRAPIAKVPAPISVISAPGAVPVLPLGIPQVKGAGFESTPKTGLVDGLRQTQATLSDENASDGAKRQSLDTLFGERGSAEPDAPQGPSLGVDLSAMDRSVRPQDDFFRFVNGAWLRDFTMPPDKSRFGAFDQLSENSEMAVKAIIQEEAASAHVSGTDGQRIADLYKSFMETAVIEARGLKPVAPELARIDRVKAKKELPALFARALMDGVQTPIGLSVDQDAKEPAVYIAGLSQAGLGLPDRDYYFKNDEQAAKIRAKYLEYVTALLRLAGEPQPEAKAKKVFALEKSLARHHWTRVENRDSDKTYNKVAVKDLGALARGFDWVAYLRAAKIRRQEEHVIVAQPSYLTGLAEALRRQPLSSWKLYMKVRTLDSAAAFLPEAFVQAAFEYKGRTLSGQPEMRPRWKRGVDLVNGAVGELIGQIFVKKHFPESSKRRMERMVENLRAAFVQRIQGLPWMKDETKKKALEKLAKFTPKIGYPEQWRDYAKLKIRADDLLGNVRRSNRFDYAMMAGKLGRPVDRGEWLMTPQTVNAYYNPVMNEIVFPAAILQFPFFNPEADDAVNYGAIGGVIGHEMSHGFDDQGAKFDGDGVLRDWWSKDDQAEFQSRTGVLVSQFDRFEPLPGERINGKLTLGENIGDLGGITVAFHAYHLALAGAPAPVIEGFTGDQRVFLGWSQVWRGAIRDNALRLRLATDPHSPAEYRVNGVMPNVPEFYEAFALKPGDKLYLPEKDRVGIW